MPDIESALTMGKAMLELLYQDTPNSETVVCVEKRLRAPLIDENGCDLEILENRDILEQA